MGVIEILTIIAGTLKLLNLTTISWAWILLPEGIMIVLYIIFMLSAIHYTD